MSPGPVIVVEGVPFFAPQFGKDPVKYAPFQESP